MNSRNLKHLLTVFLVLYINFVNAQYPHVYSHKNSEKNYNSYSISNASYRLIKSEPIYADTADLVEYRHCHENPMVGHKQRTIVSRVAEVAGAGLGYESSGKSFKPFGAIIGAIIGKNIGDNISPPRKVTSGNYTHCGRSYKNVVVNKQVGYRHYYRSDDGQIRVVNEYND